MSAEELAALVCQSLEGAGISVTLTGGGCVAIWSEGKYVSRDLDFIEEGPVPRRHVRAVLESLGFEERNKYFVHPESPFFVEFPTGPLMVGDERIEVIERRDTPTGSLRLLSPTDSVKDRLAAYFHWNDRQALEQALLVARAQPVNIREIRRWSKAEGALDKFAVFQDRLGQPAARRRT